MLGELFLINVLFLALLTPYPIPGSVLLMFSWSLLSIFNDSDVMGLNSEGPRVFAADNGADDDDFVVGDAQKVSDENALVSADDEQAKYSQNKNDCFVLACAWPHLASSLVALTGPTMHSRPKPV